MGPTRSCCHWSTVLDWKSTVENAPHSSCTATPGRFKVRARDQPWIRESLMAIFFMLIWLSTNKAKKQLKITAKHNHNNKCMAILRTWPFSDGEFTWPFWKRDLQRPGDKRITLNHLGVEGFLTLIFWGPPKQVAVNVHHLYSANTSHTCVKLWYTMLSRQVIFRNLKTIAF